MAFQHSYGVDMGAGSVKIYDRRSNTISAEANLAARWNEDEFLAIGNEAAEIAERTPSDIEVVAPISNSRISDVVTMEAILHTALSRTRSRVGLHPTLLFSIPIDMTEIERRAYYSIAHKGRWKRGRVFFVERPFADALSQDEQVRTYRGRMIVNIGAGNTEISVLTGEHIIFSQLSEQGGNTINLAIQEALRQRHQLLASARTAERLKREMGSLAATQTDLVSVSGIDAASGLPRRGLISPVAVSEAVREQADAIIAEVRRSMDRTPPQIRSIIQEEGILLAGGTSRIEGLGARMQELLGCPVVTSKYHEFATARGLAAILQNDKLQSLIFGLSR